MCHLITPFTMVTILRQYMAHKECFDIRKVFECFSLVGFLHIGKIAMTV